jgi:hypothetical protein
MPMVPAMKIAIFTSGQVRGNDLTLPRRHFFFAKQRNQPPY